MPDWLEKIKSGARQIAPRANLPAVTRPGALPAANGSRSRSAPQNLPNASIIYGIGAALLFVATFFLLLSANWFAALGVFALGTCLTGFALHLMKHQD